MRLLEVGELVEYYSRRYDPEPSHVGKVLESLPKGIPSYPHPMVKLEGKAGYLSAEHCMPAKVTRNITQVGTPMRAPGCTCTEPANQQAGHQGMCPLSGGSLK